MPEDFSTQPVDANVARQGKCNLQVDCFMASTVDGDDSLTRCRLCQMKFCLIDHAQERGRTLLMGRANLSGSAVGDNADLCSVFRGGKITTDFAQIFSNCVTTNSKTWVFDEPSTIEELTVTLVRENDKDAPPRWLLKWASRLNFTKVEYQVGEGPHWFKQSLTTTADKVAQLRL